MLGNHAVGLGRRGALTLLGAAAMSGPPAAAQAWPTRPVRLVTPYGAGNQADQVARVVAEELGQRWGQRVVVDNVPGAGGAIGVAQIARAAPDGYTIGLIAIAALAITPHISRAPYDPLTDLTPLGAVSVSRDVLVVHPSVPARTLDEFVAHARARPANDPLFYWSAGAGTVPHLNIEILCRALNIPAQHVPYRTAAAGAADQIAGRIHFALGAATVNLPHIRNGALVPIFANAPQRLAMLPALPTLTELAPAIRLPNAWQSIHGPRGLPEAITARISADLAAIVGSPAYAQRLPEGSDALPWGPEEVARTMREDHARFGQLVAELGLRES